MNKNPTIKELEG